MQDVYTTVVQILPGKRGLDDAGFSAPSRQHDVLSYSLAYISGHTRNVAALKGIHDGSGDR